MIRKRIVIENECQATCELCPPDKCLNFSGRVGPATTCWISDCGTLCADCETITLDPCNEPEHLDIMTRLIAARTDGLNRTGKGEDILSALAILFPGFPAQIVHVGLGRVLVSIGRDLTELERSFLRQLIDAVPAGFRVAIEIVTPCPEPL